MAQLASHLAPSKDTPRPSAPSRRSAGAAAEGQRRPIVIQGPMPIEAEFFASQLSDVSIDSVANFVFYSGMLDGWPVCVCKTAKGMENTAAATALAVERYKPLAIINQGTAGGHDPALLVGDIVLGKRVLNIGNLKSPFRDAGEGSTPTSWIPMDIMASEGSAGEDPNAEKARYHSGSAELLAAANAVKHQYKRGKVVEGTIASANFWNSEVDRIAWFHTTFGTSVEEMEGAAAAMIGEAYGIPTLGIRVLSNNLSNGGAYDATTARDCQEFTLDVVRHYISGLKKGTAGAGAGAGAGACLRSNPTSDVSAALPQPNAVPGLALTTQQVAHFKTFGFLILRDYLKPHEVQQCSAEFAAGLERKDKTDRIAGPRLQLNWSNLDEHSPFIQSLLEDRRFFGAAQQLLGPDAIGFDSNCNFYSGDRSPWHPDVRFPIDFLLVYDCFATHLCLF